MRRFVTWPAPLSEGGVAEESALIFDQARKNRLLIFPALFDEANKLRHQTVEVMRRLDLSGIDSFLPDLPGCNDSVQPLEKQTLRNWRTGAARACEHFGATRVVTMRSGALLAPSDIYGWRYAPLGGKKAIRALLRARTIAAKESGRTEKLADLERKGRAEGVELAGWPLGRELFAELTEAELPASEKLIDIQQDAVTGPGLWLRAEPDEDPEQADALAAILAVGMLDR